MSDKKTILMLCDVREPGERSQSPSSGPVWIGRRSLIEPMQVALQSRSYPAIHTALELGASFELFDADGYTPHYVRACHRNIDERLKGAQPSPDAPWIDRVMFEAVTRAEGFAVQAEAMLDDTMTLQQLLKAECKGGAGRIAWSGVAGSFLATCLPEGWNITRAELALDELARTRLVTVNQDAALRMKWVVTHAEDAAVTTPGAGDEELWHPASWFIGKGWVTNDSRLSKLADNHPEIRRKATDADRERFNNPMLQYLFNAFGVYKLTEGKGDAPAR